MAFVWRVVAVLNKTPSPRSPTHLTMDSAPSSPDGDSVPSSPDSDDTYPDHMQALQVAIKNDDPEGVRDAVRRGADPNDELFGKGINALRYAVKHDRKCIVRLLLDLGAEVDGECSECSTICNDTPLHWACLFNRLTITRMLLEHGADINADDWMGVTPLHISCRRDRPDIVSLLLEGRADPNICTHDKSTPLFISASEGHHAIAALLLEHRADVNAHTTRGTPLYSACANGHKAAARALLEHGADIEAGTVRMHTPLHAAIVDNRRPCIKLLIRYGANKQFLDDVESPSYLAHGSIDEGIEYARQLEFVWSPTMHWCIRRARPEFHAAVRTLLLLRNADGAAFTWLPNELMFELFRALL